MARSMTGFGRAKRETQGIEFNLEVKTLNHRYLDINMRLPRGVSFLEEDIRSLVQARIERGRVEIYISHSGQGKDRVEVQLNQPLVQSYITSFKNLAKEYDIDPHINLSTITNIQDIFTMVEKEQDEDSIRSAVLDALEEALDMVEDMRLKEGQKLRDDMVMRCQLIGTMVEEIETRSPTVVEEYRAKLKKRIEELVQSTELDENRFNAEVVFFADRSNITEEIVRLRSHIDQFGDILKQRESVGRKLDFLVQEMNREINTVGSKANDLEIIKYVVDIKSEIEKIREQVQNME
ncbi:MAG TPA: YicC/YloC family endoribonuclease [Clostridia bacterium]|nr:YicC/YloC family endoribonuclease [Clostridia bacterium]